MKLQVLQEDFSKALSISLRFTSAKAQLPVLANIYLQAQKSKLLISATNLEVSISLFIGAKVEEEGDITIPAKTITDLISNLGRGQVTLETEKEQLKVTTEDVESVISGINASDFPAIPNKINKTNISLPREKLVRALSKVIFAVSNDEARPILTGVLSIVKDNTMVFVATDGFRLSQVKFSMDNKSDETVILPKNSLIELSRLTGDSEVVDLEIRKSENQVVFGVAGDILSTRTIEGEFPAFEKIIPKERKIAVNVNKSDFLRAVKLASVFARDSANVIKLDVDNTDRMHVYAESARSGKQKTTIDAKVSLDGVGKEGFVIAFNYRFIEEFLNVVSGESVDIAFNDVNAPGVFTDPTDKEFLHIIMPVRI